jgi:hypothetical protein
MKVQMQQSEDTQRPTATQRPGVCPSCGQSTQFRLVGSQRWPQAVVEATGLGPLVNLWTCVQCRTTLTETAGEE